MLIFYYVIGVNLQPYLFGIYFSELLKYFNIISAPAAGDTTTSRTPSVS